MKQLYRATAHTAILYAVPLDGGIITGIKTQGKG